MTFTVTNRKPSQSDLKKQIIEWFSHLKSPTVGCASDMWDSEIKDIMGAGAPFITLCLVLHPVYWIHSQLNPIHFPTPSFASRPQDECKIDCLSCQKVQSHWVA